MQIPTLEDRISETVLAVLKKQSVLHSDPVPPGAEAEPWGGTLSAAVTFCGPVSGILTVQAKGKITEDIHRDRGSIRKFEGFRSFAEDLCDALLAEVSGFESVFTVTGTDIPVLQNTVLEGEDVYSRVFLEFETGSIEVNLCFSDLSVQNCDKKQAVFEHTHN